nr:MAG TPA: hypothetical protein [Bacteriophage sp.]
MKKLFLMEPINNLDFFLQKILMLYHLPICKRNFYLYNELYLLYIRLFLRIFYHHHLNHL